MTRTKKGELSSITGWIEYFAELFQTADILKIVSWLRFILKKQEPNRVQLCLCGSGKKYRHCHRDVYRKISIFDQSELREITRILIESKEFKIAYHQYELPPS